MTTKKINRREFMGEFGMRLAGTGLLLNELRAKPALGAKGPPPTEKKELTMEYRTLGNTGLKVSAVSFGMMSVQEPAVLFKALDLGINYFDTADDYLNGNSEKLIGEVAKEYGRQKVFIATKIHPFRTGERKTVDEKLGKSLKRLQTDYVDVLVVHSIMDKNWLLDGEILELLAKFKKDGRARFVGISLHDPRFYVDVVDQLSKSTVYDVVSAWFGFQSPPEHGEALRRARKANKGVIAMKAMGGGYQTGATATLSPHQAALKWALDKDFVDCAISGMVNIEQVVENVGAVGKKTGWSDRKTLHAYYSSIKHRYCIMCGKCASSCANNVDIHATNRALMYCEGYRSKTYRALGNRNNGLACVSCSFPTCRCANGIKIAERMRHAHSLLA
jgi:predicted aldo/keto reductase-like oxidoreductase